MFGRDAWGKSSIGLAGLALWATTMGSMPAAAETISFSGDVVPILEVRCQSCHKPGGEGFVKSGLDLTSYQGVMKGTKYGPVVVPGDALLSNLIAVIEGRVSAAIQMPHNKKNLTNTEISILRQWVNQGAKDN